MASAAADATLSQLAQTDPEAGLLGRIYELFDVRPSAFRQVDLPAADSSVLATLHSAIRLCQPVNFGYTDLSRNTTARTVLPLALVHPPQGVKLIAYCKERQDFRQFFVRAMFDVIQVPGDFTERRISLLAAFLEKVSAPT